MIDDETVIRVLMHHKLLSPFMLTQAQRIQKRTEDSLYQILLSNSFVNEEKALGALSPFIDTPSVSLSEFDGENELLSTVTRDVATKHRVIPLGLMTENEQEWLVLAMADPTDMGAIEVLTQLTGRDVKPVLVGPGDLKKAMVRCYGEPPRPRESAATEPHDAVTGESDFLDDSFKVESVDEPFPWEEVALDSRTDHYLDGILDDSDVVLLDQPLAADEYSSDIEAESVALEPKQDSNFETKYSKPKQDEPSNVFRDFIRKSSVMIIPPPAPTAVARQAIRASRPELVVQALVDVLLERDLLTATEILQVLENMEEKSGKSG